MTTPMVLANCVVGLNTITSVPANSSGMWPGRA